MRKTITVSLPHDLGEEEARRRLVNGLADMRSRYPNYLQNARETWNGNTMEFVASALGQTVSGRVQVQPKHVQVQVDLPLLLAMLAGKLLPQIEKEGKKMLEGPKK
jgi:Putative polyhydroxyalkanoic acid system protein (PHA_gran_rgn)